MASRIRWSMEDGTTAWQRYIAFWAHTGHYFSHDTWQGVLTAADGEKYEGEWQQGKRCGYGVHVSANSSFYDGEWKDDVRHGKGTQHNAETGFNYNGKLCRRMTH